MSTILSLDSKPSLIRLWLELIGLYILFPLTLYFKLLPLPLMGVLTLMGGLFFWVLWRDPTFDRAYLINWRIRKKDWLMLCLGFLAMAVIMVIATWWIRPENLFYLPKERPWLLLLIAIFYPLFSVIPQGIVYRSLFFHRYADLFKPFWLKILVNASLFSFGHILFENVIALLLTFFGGVLFAWRYLNTQSLPVSIFEHALYGVWLFTCGLGIFLVLGATG